MLGSNPWIKKVEDNSKNAPNEIQELGRVSHRMSIITIFGHHTHFKQDFHQYIFFLNQQSTILVHVWNQFAKKFCSNINSKMIHKF